MIIGRPRPLPGGRQKRSYAISQNAAALNAKMPMPIHTIVMVMAAGRGSLIKRRLRPVVPSGMSKAVH
jgi:hypothetical protein